MNIENERHVLHRRPLSIGLSTDFDVQGDAIAIARHCCAMLKTCLIPG